MTAPDRIYLQFVDDENEWFTESTWCTDKINEDDVLYIRAADLEAERDQLRTERERLLEEGPIRTGGNKPQTDTPRPACNPVERRPTITTDVTRYAVYRGSLIPGEVMEKWGEVEVVFATDYDAMRERLIQSTTARAK